MKERVILAMLLIVGATLLGFAAVPPPSAEYQALDAEGEPLRSGFNADRGKVRVLVYVSPTCGGCLRLADDLQKEVLSKVDDSDLAVYLVWAPRNGAEESHVERVTGLVDDPRAHQFWDGHGAVADPVDAMLELTGPCAGVALLYGPEASWDGAAPPAPTYWEDAHDFEFHRAAEQFDAGRFTGRIQAMMASRAKKRETGK
ncbi:MAG: hypothetical protein ACREK5_03365 [Gemmatimonadota bacterium]